MKYERQRSGNLVMTAEDGDRQDIKTMFGDDLVTSAAEERWIEEHEPDGLALVRPEDVGALTSAPMFMKDNHVFAYMDYQVSSFLEELMAGREVVWTRG